VQASRYTLAEQVNHHAAGTFVLPPLFLHFFVRQGSLMEHLLTRAKEHGASATLYRFWYGPFISDAGAKCCIWQFRFDQNSIPSWTPMPGLASGICCIIDTVCPCCAERGESSHVMNFLKPTLPANHHDLDKVGTMQDIGEEAVFMCDAGANAIYYRP